MSSQALDGASKYLNNLLLARGLLKDGKQIDFACQNGSSEPIDATMSRVVNLVHDLVLRRDRDSDQKESLTANIRNLRSEETQRVLEYQKLQDKNVQLVANAQTAEAQQRTLEAAAKKAEKQAKELKEQMLKMKSTLDHVRAKCISDVRKRDIEIEKLKSHLSGMQRGKKDQGGMKIYTMNTQTAGAGRETRNGHETNTSEWSLENETNGFLAALVDETSTENVALRKIVNDSMVYLKDLTGFEQEILDKAQSNDEGIGIPGRYRRDRTDSGHESELVPVRTLAVEISQILDHCRVLLKDPSFVPIEEVQIRDEEILKLRAGWEKMADRWKQAVTMMSQWRQKMMNSQDHDDFQTDGLSGLGVFGRSIAVRPDGQPVLAAIEEEGLSSLLFDNGKAVEESVALIDPSSSDSSTVSEPEETGTQVHLAESFEEDSEVDLAEQPAIKRFAASPAKRGIQLPRSIPKPLSEANGNTRRTHANKSLKPSNTQENTENLGYESSEEEDFADLYRSERTKSRLPRLTVAEKLAAVEVEANEATQDLRRRQATQKRKPSDRIKKISRTSRRRSTLSPEELAQLMGG